MARLWEEKGEARDNRGRKDILPYHSDNPRSTNTPMTVQKIFSSTPPPAIQCALVIVRAW